MLPSGGGAGAGSEAGRGPERAAPHRCEGAACGAERSEEEGAPFGAADQGCERREGHDQQREVGDELELLRGVAVRRVAGRTRIGVRVDVGRPSMRWTWGKSVTQLQYPAKSTRSSRAPMFFSRLRIARTVWGQRYAFFAKRSAGRPLFGGRGAFSSESGISQGQR